MSTPHDRLRPPSRPLAPAGRLVTYTTLLALTLGTLGVGIAVPYIVADPSRPGGSAGASDLPALAASGGDGLNPVGAGNGKGRGGKGGKGAPSGKGGIAGLTANGVPAASGGGAAGEAGGAGTSPSGSVGPLTASDRGVTASSIKLGVFVPDIGGLSAFGVSSGFSDARGKFQAFADQINAAGGINGRKVQLVFRTTDVLSQDDMRKQCLGFANDDKVFAAFNVGAVYGSAFACVTKDTKTPLISVGAEEEQYTSSGNYFISPYESFTRDSANLAYFLDQNGLLKGRKIGVLDIDGFATSARRGFIATAKALGSPITSEYTLTASIEQASTQAPLAVAQFRRAGVDTVVLAVNGIFAGQFVQAAQQQNASWQYLASEDQGGTNADGWLGSMPNGFSDILGIATTRIGEWRAGVPQPADEKACTDTYLSKSYATKFSTRDRSSLDYFGTVLACTEMDIFARAASLAGADLTRDRFVQAVQTLGRIGMAGFGSPGVFSAGRTDGASAHRFVVAKSSCSCWQVYQRSPFYQDRY